MRPTIARDDDRALQQMAAGQIPGDTYRNLNIHPVFSGQTFKHILVPVWLLTYNFGAKPYRSWSTATRAAWRVSIRRVSGRSCCSSCSRSSLPHHHLGTGELMRTKETDQ